MARRFRIDVGSYFILYEGEELPQHLKELGNVEEITDSQQQPDAQQTDNSLSQQQDKQEKQKPKKSKT